MTELRRRMEDDMVARGLADRTRESYLWAVTGLARFYRRPPDQISDDEVQAYLVHLLRERQRSWSTCNVVANGLRFFYHTTLKRDRTTFAIPSPRQRQKLPAILSREEVEQVIAHATNLKHRTMLLTTYAAGLRLNEVLHLRVTDIDSARMTIRVEQGKGGKDRYTVLRPRLLEALRAYWKLARPRPWLFPSQRDRAAHGSQRAATRLPDGEAPRGDHETGRHSRAPPRLCDAPARSRRRHAHDSTPARPRIHQHDDAVLSIDASHGGRP